MDEQNIKKIIVFGIDNAGKSAILKTLKDKSIEKAINLPPTRGIDQDILRFGDTEYHIWELSGIHYYLNKYLSKPMIYYGTNKAIIVVDAQEPYSFEESINLFSRLIWNFSINNDLLNSDFKILIFLHKIDQGTENVEFLMSQINRLEIPFPYEIYTTSIFNFEKNKKYLNSKKFKDLVTLIVRLFSYRKLSLYSKIKNQKAIKELAEKYEKLTGKISKYFLDYQCPMCKSKICTAGSSTHYFQGTTKINLIDSIERSNMNIKIGIPCHSCFEKIFGNV